MTDKSMPNSWNTISRLPPDCGGQETLRAYTHTPEGIAIQIRGKKSYATAFLSDAQGRLFAQMILDAIDGHQ